MSKKSQSDPISVHSFVLSTEGLRRAGSVDASLRGLLGLMFGLSCFWLVMSLILGGLALAKYQMPSVLNYSFLSYGRVFPLLEIVSVYGWSLMALAALSVWVMRRHLGTGFAGGWVAYSGLLTWNLALLVGCILAMSGHVRPYRGLALVGTVHVVMLAGVFMVMLPQVWALMRRGGKLTCGLLYIVGGWVWLFWSSALSQPLILSHSVRGVGEGIIVGWSHHCVIWGTLVPVSLGIGYSVLTMATSLGVFSGALARGSFWVYFAFSAMAYPVSFVGPLPVWVSSLAGFAAMALTLPLAANAFNLMKSCSSADSAEQLRLASYFKVGIAGLLFGGCLKGICAIRSVKGILGSSGGLRAPDEFVIQVFVAMFIFGSVYFVMPRLSRCEWLSKSLSDIQILAFSYGLAGNAAIGFVASLVAGCDLADPESLFSDVVQSVAFFGWGSNICFAMCVVGCAAFCLHLALIACGIGQPEGEV